MANRFIKAAAVVLVSAISLLGQYRDGTDGPPSRPPMDHGFPMGPPGRFWGDPAVVQKIGLTADQQKKMDAVVEQHRAQLSDLLAALRKQEDVLLPMIESEQPQEAKILAQIDNVAQARAELEKANARMLLGVRSLLTQDQWKKLKADSPRMHYRGGPSREGWGPPPDHDRSH